MQYYYKLVSVDKNHDLVSAMATGKSQVIYKVNEWTKPPAWLRQLDKGLFVFDSVEHAKSFRYRVASAGTEIWHCRVRAIILNNQYCDLDYLNDGKIFETNNDFPSGSIQVKQVKLIFKHHE